MVKDKKEEILYKNTTELLQTLHLPLHEKLLSCPSDALLQNFTEMWDLQQTMHILVKDIFVSLGKYIKKNSLKNVQELQVSIFKEAVLLKNNLISKIIG